MTEPLPPTTYAEVARAESERGEVVLRRRSGGRGADVLELRVNGVFVMDSQETSSEVELASAAIAAVGHPRSVLVAGLGLGYTLQQVLTDSRVERVAVVELEEALVGWMRDGTVPHGPALLADGRLSVVTADIAMALAEATSTFDLVLLDVDNGPGYLVHDENAALYESAFLGDLRRVLEPGGVLAVWSASPAPELAAALESAYDGCEVRRIPVLLGEREEEYLLYLARRG